MPFCQSCDLELAENEGEHIASAIVKEAIRSGLRPPPGKLRRTARMIVGADSVEAIGEKEAELNRQWVDGFLNSDDESWLLCPGCKGRAAASLHRPL